MSKGYWNTTYSSNRREPLTPWNTGKLKEDASPQPMLSIQCFEQRHTDCGGKCPLMGHTCECECHEQQRSRDTEEKANG